MSPPSPFFLLFRVRPRLGHGGHIAQDRIRQRGVHFRRRGQAHVDGAGHHDGLRADQRPIHTIRGKVPGENISDAGELYPIRRVNNASEGHARGRATARAARVKGRFV